MKRIAALIIVFMAVTGCAPQLAKRTEPIRSIAVATAFGERIQMRFVGLTVFNNSADYAPVDWQIDRHVKSQVAAGLAGRYQLIDLPYDPAQFFIDARKSGAVIATDSDVVAQIKSAIPAGTADAVLVFVPTMVEDRIGKSNQYLTGPGFYGRTLLGMGTRAAFFAYQALLLDGTTMQPIGLSAGKLPQTKMLGAFTIDDVPYRELQLRWNDSYAAIPELERNILRQAVFGLFDESLPAVLKALSLR